MINWADLISQMFNGLVLGALLALIASGLTIVYGTLGVLNLAHSLQDVRDGVRRVEANKLNGVDATWVLPGHGPAWDGGTAEAVRLIRAAAAR